jgi:hypothetical protein
VDDRKRAGWISTEWFVSGSSQERKGRLPEKSQNQEEKYIDNMNDDELELDVLQMVRLTD